METPDGCSHKPTTPPVLNCGLSGQSESDDDLGALSSLFPRIFSEALVQMWMWPLSLSVSNYLLFNEQLCRMKGIVRGHCGFFFFSLFSLLSWAGFGWHRQWPESLPFVSCGWPTLVAAFCSQWTGSPSGAYWPTQKRIPKCNGLRAQNRLLLSEFGFLGKSDLRKFLSHMA